MAVSYAPVAPPTLLAQLHEYGLAGDYHLLLAHEVFNEPDVWQRTMDCIRMQGPATIFMDNSIVELGYSVGYDMLSTAADIISDAIVVLPDAFLDPNTTFDLAVVAAEKLRNYQRMVVVQGKTEQEVLEWSLALVEATTPDWLGVPRCLTDNGMPRSELVKHLWNLHKLPMHLLGFSDDLEDDFTAAHLPGVSGIDSAMPIWSGIKGIEIRRDKPTEERRPKDYWQMKCLTPTAVENVRKVCGWLQKP